MKRNILFAMIALTALFLSSCVKDDVYAPASGSPDLISIAATTEHSGASTRAASATIADLEKGFQVWALSGPIWPAAGYSTEWYADSDGNSIDGTNPHEYNNGVWNFERPVKWPTSASGYPMQFFALYPINPVGLSASSTGYRNPISIDYKVRSSAAEQEDLMTAYDIADGRPASSRLQLTFRHILSKVEFGVIAGAGAEIDVKQLQIVNLSYYRRYFLKENSWQPTNYSQVAATYTYYDAANPLGGSGAFSGALDADETTAEPFYTGDAAQDAQLMLMPQISAAWNPAVKSTPASNPSVGPSSKDGYICVLYRMSNKNTTDNNGMPEEVGCADAAVTFPESGLSGPLYVKVGFPIPADADGNFTWDMGYGYTYNIGLGTPNSCNGYILDENYYDQNGNRTDLPIEQVSKEGKKVGDKLQDGIIHVVVDVHGWDDGESGGDHMAGAVTIAPETTVLSYAKQPNATPTDGQPALPAQTVTVTARDSNGEIDQTGVWTIASSDSWLKLTNNPYDTTGSSTLTGAGEQTIYLIVSENTATTSRTAHIYQGGVGSQTGDPLTGNGAAATVIQLPSPKNITATTKPLGFVGAFWRANETGERLIRMTEAQVGAQWVAGVSWYDERWNPVGGDDIVLSTTPSADSSIDTDNPGNPENYQVTDGTQGVSGTVAADGTISFRVGLTKKFTAFASNDTPDYETTWPARYAVIMISAGSDVRLLYLRQGEDADYLMRTQDAVNAGGVSSRSVAVPFSPYNLTAQTLDAPVSANGAKDTGIQPATFTQYPTQVGAYWQWSSLDKTRYAWNPYTQYVSGWSVNVNKGAWTAVGVENESCPAGYRRPSDGPTDVTVATYTEADLQQSEVRLSLFANPPATTWFTDSNFGAISNYISGYYADGYFDRRPVSLDANTSLYGVATGNAGVAYEGGLFFNTATYASLFLPKAGQRGRYTNTSDPQDPNGTLFACAGDASYWSSTRQADGSAYRFAGYPVMAEGSAIRCVRDPNATPPAKIDPDDVPQDVVPANVIPYVGAFWKDSQTGERLIRPLNNDGTPLANGAWEAQVVGDGQSWITLDKAMTADVNVGWRTDGLSNGQPIYDGNADGFDTYETVGGTWYVRGTATTDDPLYFRIGLKSANPHPGTPRYGLVVLTYGDGAYSQRIFIRQGEGDDYVMRPNDPSTGAWLAQTRPAAMMFSPYNLTVPAGFVFDAGMGGGIMQSKAGILTDYPTQAGGYFGWSNNVAVDPTNPAFGTFSDPRVRDSGFGTDYCPVGYHLPKDGAHNATQGVSEIDGATSEIRQSLWLAPPQNANVNLTGNNANYLWGYYADGYFDRRKIVENPTTLYPSTTKTGSSTAWTAVTASPTDGSALHIGFAGGLCYNPTTNASLFFPCAGSVDINGNFNGIGQAGCYWTQSRWNTDLGGEAGRHIIAQFEDNDASTNGQRGGVASMRCVKDTPTPVSNDGGDYVGGGIDEMD